MSEQATWSRPATQGKRHRQAAPQFLERGHATLETGIGMAALIVALDLVWFSALAFVIARARRAFTSGPWQRRLERLTGSVMVGLGLLLALEAR